MGVTPTRERELVETIITLSAAARDAQSRAATAIKTRDAAIVRALEYKLPDRTVARAAGMSRSGLWKIKKRAG